MARRWPARQNVASRLDAAPTSGLGARQIRRGADVAKRLTYYILGGLVLGILVGWVLNAVIAGWNARGDGEAGADRRTISRS